MEIEVCNRSLFQSLLKCCGRDIRNFVAEGIAVVAHTAIRNIESTTAIVPKHGAVAKIANKIVYARKLFGRNRIKTGVIK